MKICFLGNFNSGGTERATFLVANELNKTNDVYILNTTDCSPTYELDEIKPEHLKTGSVLKTIIYLYKFLKQKKIDVLVTVEAMTGIISVPAAIMSGCRHIVWEHANYYQNQGVKYIKKIRQLELKVADAYVVLTERDFYNFKNNFDIKSNLLYIYNIAQKFNEHNYDLASKTIISAGHIRKIKNFIIIPDIAKIVFEKHPDWCWKIYGGENGEQYKELKKKIKDYGLENNIFLCGRCDDMDKAYREASMYVMTSLQEGLPMVLLEAKSNGLPLISFDIETGPSEIIKDGVNGFLIKPYEIDDMAEKIITLIENDKMRKSMSNNSVIGLDNFYKDKIIQKWNTLLEEIK
ncbi:MAG: glycosyltransferase family 4 protein [Erysipelotrichia bacterium]|nr:glycosyltransferase family 4 protein [Erysipelotrichia bacterium]